MEVIFYMSYGHKYYTDAERLRAVKGCINANIPVTEYAKQIGVNPRTLRDWIRAFKSFDGGFINITKEAEDPNMLVSSYDMEMKILDPEEVKKKSSNFARFDRNIVVIEIGKMKMTTSLGCAKELLSKELYDLLRQC